MNAKMLFFVALPTFMILRVFLSGFDGWVLLALILWFLIGIAFILENNIALSLRMDVEDA